MSQEYNQQTKTASVFIIDSLTLDLQYQQLDLSLLYIVLLVSQWCTGYNEHDTTQDHFRCANRSSTQRTCVICKTPTVVKTLGCIAIVCDASRGCLLDNRTCLGSGGPLLKSSIAPCPNAAALGRTPNVAVCMSLCLYPSHLTLCHWQSVEAQEQVQQMRGCGHSPLDLACRSRKVLQVASQTLVQVSWSHVQVEVELQMQCILQFHTHNSFIIICFVATCCAVSLKKQTHKVTKQTSVISDSTSNPQKHINYQQDTTYCIQSND